MDRGEHSNAERVETFRGKIVVVRLKEIETRTDRMDIIFLDAIIITDYS